MGTSTFNCCRVPAIIIPIPTSCLQFSSDCKESTIFKSDNNTLKGDLFRRCVLVALHMALCFVVIYHLSVWCRLGIWVSFRFIYWHPFNSLPSMKQNSWSNICVRSRREYNDIYVRDYTIIYQRRDDRVPLAKFNGRSDRCIAWALETFPTNDYICIEIKYLKCTL